MTEDALFSLARFAADGDTVIRRGKVFEAGNYPEKRFRLTPEEAAAAVAAFAPAPIDMEHTQSLFDGKLGQLTELSLAEDGVSLHGTATIPRWLDELFPDAPIPVSCTWNRETKRLEKLALVVDPHIEDAQLVAAFAKARHNTPHGQMAIQDIHDAAARAGAVCNAPVQMASRHEAKGIQQAHDIAVEHGAQCASVPAGRTAGGYPMLFSRTKEKGMSFKDRVAAWFHAGMPDEFPDEPAPEAPSPVTPPVAAVPANVSQFARTPDPRVDELEKQLAAERAARIESEAAAFADAEIAAERAVKAERDALITCFRQASLDDIKHGSVTFSDGSDPTSRVEQLRALYAARPAHLLSAEQLDPNQVAAIFVNQQKTLGNGAKPFPDERRRELLAKTGLGREVLTSGS